jgi:hypothetical protein
MQGERNIPLGVYTQIQDNTLRIEAMICDIEGKTYINRSQTCATNLAHDMLEAGGRQILDQKQRLRTVHPIRASHWLPSFWKQTLFSRARNDPPFRPGV